MQPQPLLHTPPRVPRGAEHSPPPPPPPPTPQGIELANPNQAALDDRMRGGTESYFSEYSGFKSAAAAAARKG